MAESAPEIAWLFLVSSIETAAELPGIDNGGGEMRNAAGNGAPLCYGKRLEPLTRWLICAQPQHLIDVIWWSDLGLDKKHPLSRFSCVDRKSTRLNSSHRC